jgi:hypothetical protein
MINISQLENVCRSQGKVIAACPACRAEGKDNQGNHLAVFNDGKYGCVKHPKDNEHNKKIYALVGQKRNRTPSDCREQRLMRKKQLEAEIRADRDRKRTAYLRVNMESMIAEYRSKSWRAQLMDESPVLPQQRETIRHDFVKGLFMPDDILWMSKSLTDTGLPEHAKYFRKCSEWIKDPNLPPRIAAGTFRLGSYSRSLGCLKSSPYIVIEADDLIGHKPTTPEECELNKAYCAALIGYAREHLGLVLRAVLDTGNKSLHAWFDRPSEANFEAIKRMAEGLGIDKSVIENCQAMPLRMPGCPHMKTMTPAQLIYLNPII